MTLKQQLLTAEDCCQRLQIVTSWLRLHLEQTGQGETGALLDRMTAELEQAAVAYRRCDREIERLSERIDQQTDQALRRKSLRRISELESLIRRHVPVSRAKESAQ